MNKENKPHENYLRENEYILSLKRVISDGKERSYDIDSLRWIIKKKFSSLLSGLSTYLQEILKTRKTLLKTYLSKNIGVGRYALILGNGPSQGYLSLDDLKNFKQQKGDVFVINFWNENKLISNFIPDFLVISDPLTLSSFGEDILGIKNTKLHSYLMKNEEIKILCPTLRSIELNEIYGLNRVLGFSDADLRLWTNNYCPILPRGYVSMTIFKALAMAHWFNYERIYVLGMDNTYPRNIYCDKENKFINHEVHSGADDFAIDFSRIYGTISDGLIEISYIFRDAYKFKSDKVINLDEYSLTDAFKKINFRIWSQNLKNSNGF